MPFRTDPENLEIGVKILSDLHPSPAFIFLACGPEQAGIIIRRLREGGLKMPIIGGDSFDTPGLIPQAGELADNIFFTSHAFLNASNPSPLVKYFINSFQSEYHRMPENAFAALGYDAVNLAARALRQSGSAEPAAVRDAMAGTIGFQGVTGELSYHNSNHVPIKRVSIVNIKNGNLSLADTVLPRQIPDP
jgi:branched-chain amino acid transport system substrate-binding protein